MRLAAITCVLAAACGGDVRPPAVAGTVAAPAGGEPVSCAESLQARVDAAAPGAVLLLEPGEHVGPVAIRRPLTLWGPPTAVVRSGGEGSTFSVIADHVALLGFTVAGSGQRFDLLDGGVRVHGHDLRLEGLSVRGALFGILVEQSSRVQVLNNHVVGSADPAMGLRGDGIRLWETTDSEVAGNVVEDSRDMVVWYSSRNRVADNTIRRCRYGTHFMFSHDNTVVGNRYVDDVVGVFVMYSHDLNIARNVMARAGGAAGIGLGIKESGNITVEDNWLVADATGIHLDHAPMAPEHELRFARNVVRLCETAVAFHASTARTAFVDNDFGDNGTVVKVGGEGDALGCDFHGNHYDTYRGYDLDGDGIGDLPFEFSRLSTQLEARYPELALMHGAPAMQLVDMVGEVMPLFAPRRLLCDPAPRMQAVPPRFVPEVQHAR